MNINENVILAVAITVAILGGTTSIMASALLVVAYGWLAALFGSFLIMNMCVKIARENL